MSISSYVDKIKAVGSDVVSQVTGSIEKNVNLMNIHGWGNKTITQEDHMKITNSLYDINVLMTDLLLASRGITLLDPKLGHECARIISQTTFACNTIRHTLGDPQEKIVIT